MRKYYTLFIIRKSDKKVIRRYQAKAVTYADWQKQVEEQTKRTLNNYLDLDRKDISCVTYEGVLEDPSDAYG